MSNSGWRQRLRTTTALQAVATAALLAAPLPAAAQLSPNARPSGGQVVAGQASIGQSTTTTTISQSSQRAAVNWQSFDIGSQQTVQFRQPSSSAVTLNRVTGPNPSEIAGHIQANGQLVVVNQSGVVFDRGAQVNAAGLVVSAAGISDRNFMAGKMVFDQAAHAGAKIENRGTITVKDHGLAALVAPQVRNSGTIAARLGTVILAGAEADTLDLYGDGLVSINVTKQVRSAPNGTKALVTNTGVVSAPGGTVVLTADAVDGVVQTLVDAGGRISANSTVGQTGTVLISGSGGDVRVEGAVSAQGRLAGTTGGSVMISGSGATVIGAKAQVSASGKAGGGTIALGTTLARAAGGSGTAAATTGKLVVKKGATVSADATVQGNGGRVVLLSTGGTTMADTITAKGGTAGGNGGTVEISGGTVNLTGHVDATAPIGTTGTLLLDPSDLWVSNTRPSVATYTVTGSDLPTVGAGDAPNLATVSWVSPTLLESQNANIKLAATDNLYVASSYNTANTLHLGNFTLTLTGGTGLSIDRGFGINASSISLTSQSGPITLDSAAGVSAGLITAPQLANLSDTALSGTTLTMAGAGGIALGSATLGTALKPLTTLDLSSSGGSVTQTAGGRIYATTLTSSANVSGSVDLAGTGNQITNLGALVATSGITLNDSATTLTVAGPVNGGSGIAITNTGGLMISADLVATGTVALNAAGILQFGSAAITAGTLTGTAGSRSAILGGPNNVKHLGAFSAQGGVVLVDNAASLTVTGAVNGGPGGIYLINSGSLAVDATLTSTATIGLLANGITQDSAGIITARVLTGDAGTGAAHLGIATNVVTALRAFSAEQGFALRDNVPLLTVTSGVSGGSATYIVNTGSVLITGPVSASGIVDLVGAGITQTSAGTITAGTLTGDAGAGAAHLGVATNDVTTLGAFTAAQGFGLNDNVSLLTVTGPVDGGASVHLVNTGGLSIAAPVSASGIVDLVADGIAQTGGGTITAGTLTGDAGAGAAHLGLATNDVVNLGSFTATQGFALRDGAPVLTVTGMVDGGASVYLVNTGSLAVDAPVMASGTVDLVGNGITQSSGGIITAGMLMGDAGSGAAHLGIATNEVTNLGPFTADQGVALRDGVPVLTVAGAVDGGKSVSIVNTGSLVIGAPVTAGGPVDLVADGIAQYVGGTITAQTLIGDAGAGAANLGIATNEVGTLGAFSATQGFALRDGVAVLTVAGAVDGGASVYLVNTGSLAIDAPVTASGTVDLVGITGITQTAAGVVTTGLLTGGSSQGAVHLGVAVNDVTNLDSFFAKQGLGLRDDVPVLTVDGTVNGGTSVYLVNTGSLSIAAPVTASGTVDLVGSGITQTSAGTITAGTLIGDAGTGAAELVAATNDVTRLGPFAATTGFALADKVSTLTVVGTVNGGTGVAIANTGSVVVAAPITATGTVDLVGTGITQTSAGTITADTLTGDARTGAAHLGLATNDVTNLGSFTADQGFGLRDKTSVLTVAGAVDGGTSVYLVNTGSLALDAPITATGIVDLVGSSITQSSAGTITAGTLTGDAGTGAAHLGLAANDVTNLGAFTADQGFGLRDNVTLLTVTGAVDGGKSVSIVNSGSLVIGAPVTASGSVDLVADGITQTGSGTITAGTLIGNAGAGGAHLAIATNDVTTLGAFSAAQGFALRDGVKLLTVAGAVDGGASVYLLNTGSLMIEAPVTATGLVDLVADGIAQTGGGIISAGTLMGDAGSGAAHLGLATNDVTMLDSFTATDGFGLRDGVALLTVAGAVDGGKSVSIVNSGSLLIGAPVTASGSVDLVADGITQDGGGTITAQTLIGDAGAGAAHLAIATNDVATLGAFTATQGFALRDNVPLLTVAGAVDGGSSVYLLNTGSLAIEAPVTASGLVDLVADGISQTGGGIITAGTLMGDAGAGAAHLGIATNDVTTLGAFGATQGFALRDATPLLTVTGAVDGGVAVYLVNTGALSVDAPVTATGLVDLMANGIAQTGSGTITAQTLTGDAGTGAAHLGLATNDISDLGPFTATDGFALRDNVNLLTVTGAVDGGTSVYLVNTGSLAIAAPVTASGIVELVADGITQTSAGAITAGTLTGNAGAGAAHLGITTNAVQNLGSFSATQGFGLRDGEQSLTVIGPVDGGTSVYLANTGSLAIDAPLSASGIVDLVADGIGQSQAGVITAGTLTGDAGAGAAGLGVATNAVTNLGPFVAATGFQLNDGVPVLTVVGAVDGGTAVTLMNSGSLVLAASVSGTNLVDLVGNGITQNAGAITAQTLTGNAGAGAADLGGSANMVGDLGPFAATTGFTFNDAVTSTLTVVGAVDGGTGVAITTRGGLAIDAAVTGSGLVDLVAADGITQTSGGVVAAGTLVGDAGTGAADLAVALNKVLNLGPFATAQGFLLTDSVKLLTVVGAIGGGPVVYLGNTGSLAIDAPVTAADTVSLVADGIGQSSLGVITTAMLIGSSGSGAADLGTATNLVDNLGPFTATTGFTLNDDVGTLTVAGAVNGGTGVSLTNNGSLVIDAGVSGTNTVSLVAEGISQSVAGIITAGTLTGDAGSGAAALGTATNLVTNLGPFTTGGAFTLLDGHDLTVIGNVTAGTDATITVNGAGNNLTIDAGAAVQSGVLHTVALAANGGNLANAGFVGGGELASLMASNDIDQAGNVGALSIVENAGHDINHSGTSFAGGGNISLTAGNVIAQSVGAGMGAILANNGDITLVANGTGQPFDIAQTAGATIDAFSNPGPTISLTAATGIAFAGTIQANGPSFADGTIVLIARAGDITETAGGSHTGTLIAMNLTGSAGAGYGASGQAMLDAPSPTGVSNQIFNLGPFQTAGGFTLIDGYNLHVVANVTAGGDAAIAVNGAGNALTVNAGVTVQAGGTAALAASGGNLTNNGSIGGGVLAGLVAGANLYQNGVVSADAVTELAATDIDHQGTSVATNGDASLTATSGTLTQNGTVTAGNAATLLAGTDLSQTGTVTATNGNATLMAGGNLTQSGVVTAGADANLTATNGTLTQNGTVKADHAATLVAGADLSQIGTVTAAGGDATLTAGGNLTQSGAVAAGADATLTATNGMLTQNGIVTAGNSATLVAGADLSQIGAVTATAGNASLTAGGNLTQTGVVTAGTSAALTATNGTLNQNGTVTAGNAATLVAGADLSQIGMVTATSGNASLTAGGNLTQSNIVTAGTNASLTATNGTLTQTGTVTAGGDANLTATNGTLDQYGAVTAGNAVTLLAGNNLAQAGLVDAAGGSASLTATNGTLTQTGTVTAGSNATLTATNGALSQTGTVTAGGDASLTAGNTLTQSRIVTAGHDAVLTAQTGNLTQTGSITAGTSAILQALTGNLGEAGTVTAPNIQVSAPNGQVTFSGVFAGVKPDPTLDPHLKLKQGAFPSNLSIGAWISGSVIAVAPTAQVRGAGGGLSQLVVRLTTSGGTVNFADFQNPLTELYLDLGTGLAAGQIAVDALQVQYVVPGTTQTIDLSGTVNGESGSTAASASFILPLEKENYQVNGCPIESSNCVQITTLTLPVVNPLKDLEISTPDQADDILIILPDVGDRDY